MNKKGQLQLSFGMIFSIIIIIATVAIALYVIIHFINLSKCTQISMFYSGLKEDVDKAWASPVSSEIYTGSLPSGIDYVCFGNLSLPHARVNQEIFDDIQLHGKRDANVFLYPLNMGCSNAFPSYTLKHMSTNEFFCVPVRDGEMKVKLTKDVTDSSVKISG